LVYISWLTFFHSGHDEDEAQSRTHAIIFVQRFQPQRSDVRVHRPGRVPDVRWQLRVTVAGWPVQLRAAAGFTRLLRATAGHSRLLRAAAVGCRGTAADTGRRPDQQTAVGRGQSTATARVRANETGRAGRFKGTEQQQRGTIGQQETVQR